MSNLVEFSTSCWDRTVLNGVVLQTENFSALTRLDHNRAVGQLAIKGGCDVEDVTGCIIWGNHSSTQYPDINSATIKGEFVCIETTSSN